MTPEMDAVSGQASAVTSATTTAAHHRTRPYLWSVRRELWENRSIFIAPLIAGGLMIVGFVFDAAHLPQRRPHTLLLPAATQQLKIEQPYDFALSILMVVSMLVWVFYCLDTLYGERRDRTILFWKSMPVSDRTAVLSKFTVPFAILPAITFVLTVVVQAVMLFVSNIVLQTHGLAPATAAQLPLFQLWGAALYGLIAMTLWNAPIYAWLLLVSAWARRATLLWAFVPPLSLVALEKLAFGTDFVGLFFKWRGVGWATEAFAGVPRGKLMIDPLNPIDPAKFVSSPGLWLGLLVAALFLAAAMRLRRHRAPL